MREFLSETKQKRSMGTHKRGYGRVGTSSFPSSPSPWVGHAFALVPLLRAVTCFASVAPIGSRGQSVFALCHVTVTRRTYGRGGIAGAANHLISQDKCRLECQHSFGPASAHVNDRRASPRRRHSGPRVPFIESGIREICIRDHVRRIVLCVNQ